MADLSVFSAVNSIQQSSWTLRKTLFDQLGQALQKGDLKAAQTAFAALQKNVPQEPPPGSQGNGSPDPMAALGKALQAGDLAGAQQAFAQLQQTRRHHHHHHQDSDGDDKGLTTPTTTPSTTTTWSELKGLFDHLAEALQKGDLKAAQTAFAALQKTFPPAPSTAGQGNDTGSGSGTGTSTGSGGTTGAGPTSTNPLDALAQALKAGDLTVAQKAFSQLTQTERHHHRHRHHEDDRDQEEHRFRDGVGGTATPGLATSSTTSPAGTPVPTTRGRGGDDDGHEARAQQIGNTRIDLTA